MVVGDGSHSILIGVDLQSLEKAVLLQAIVVTVDVVIGVSMHIQEKLSISCDVDAVESECSI